MDPALAAQAVDVAGDAIITVDVEGRITSWNPAAEALLGHAADGAVGQTLALVIPAEHRPRHIAAFQKAMNTASLTNHGQPARVEAIHNNGSTIAMNMTLGVLVDVDGTAAGAAAVLRATEVDPIPFV
jgi:PAS domain S-box-containing protein